MRVLRVAALSISLAFLAAVPAGAQSQPLPVSTPESSPAPVPTPSATPAPEPEPTATPDRPRSLPAGRTLRSALRRAWLAGGIDRAAYEEGLAVSDSVRRALGRLQGRRRAELAAVMKMVERLAGEGRLSPSRMALAVETLRRNVHAWRVQGLPGTGERRVFDGLVFQYVPGRGFHHHPLGSFGRANALAKPCVRAAQRRRRVLAAARARSMARARFMVRAGESRPVRPRLRPLGTAPGCRDRALRRTADRLVALAADRGGFLAWEYLYPYGGRSWPWMSAMTQATGVQALARTADALGDQSYAAIAERALGAFEAAPPAGVRVGGRFAMYSQAPSLDVLNGFLQALIGLHDHAEATGSARSAALFRAAERNAPAAVRAADTGAWSLYSRGGREASLHYHRLVIDFLGGLCDRTKRRVYCSAERRFAFYTREAPQVRVDWPAEPRARSASRVVVTLSKTSTVRLAGAGDRRRAALPRGTHALTWVPARKGRREVRLSATGPEGRTARVSQKVAVRPSWAEVAARRRRQLERREDFERARRRAARAHDLAVRRSAP